MKPSNLLWITIIVLVIVVLVLLIKAVMLFASVERYAQYWTMQNTRTSQDKPVVYVALGDSAAQGIGASSPEKGYVGLVAERLAQQKSRPVHIINLSKSGAKIADVTKNQVPLLADLKPDIITLDIGGNDIQSFNTESFTAQANELFAVLPAKTLVADVPFFGGRSRFLDSKSDEKVVQANSILASIAKQRGMTLVPLYEQTKKYNQYPWSYAIDYFHPNNLGYQVWANVFWNAIR